MPREPVKEKRQRKAKTQTCKALLPCKTCPWRVDSDVWAIPGYVPEKASGLLRTASMGNGDGFRPIMACHNSTDTKMHACKGYLAREGWSNLNVRLLLAKGHIENPTAVLEACETHGVSLEPEYPAVLRKLEGQADA
jgi:hypothetical protein